MVDSYEPKNLATLSAVGRWGAHASSPKNAKGLYRSHGHHWLDRCGAPCMGEAGEECDEDHRGADDVGERLHVAHRMPRLSPWRRTMAAVMRSPRTTPGIASFTTSKRIMPIMFPREAPSAARTAISRVRVATINPTTP